MSNSTKKYKPIRTGVIGVGSMGQNHARIYSEISTLIGVADPDKTQGRMVAERFGVTWYSDYRDMLGKVNAVTISVPTAQHREVAEAVIKAGVHILVEKPLAGNLVDAAAIVTAAEASGITLAVGHVERFNSVVRHAHSCIKKKEWGEIITFSAKRFSNYPSRIRDVGVLFDLTIHDVDVIGYLAGSPVVSVCAIGGKSKNDYHEDYINLVMEFEDGKIGLCETNWLTPMKVRELSMTTTSHHIKLDYLSQEVHISSSQFREFDEANLFQPPMEVNEQIISLKGKEPLKTEISDFLAAITEGRGPKVSGAEGIMAVKIVEAGMESLKGGSVINI